MAGESTTSNEQNWLDMSDEELLKAPTPDFTAVVDEVKEDGDDTPTEEEKKVVVDEEGDDDEGDEKPAAEGQPSAEKPEDGAAKEKEGEEQPAKEAKPEPKKEEKAAEVDYAAAGKELLAPFRANGRDIQVRSVEDARALMQMGANYNKKMAALKPNLKLMKMLENNDLLSEDKLSFLIDLSKKDQGAISKLVKDSGLNPMDLGDEKAGDYKPKTHSVDDRELDLDNVLDDLKGSTAYPRTLEIVSTKWDGPSKQVVAQSPQLLQVLHDHVESGIYDLIAAEVEREKTFGRLRGMSDLEAYKQVGDRLHDAGAFNHLGSSQGKAAAPKQVVEPKSKQAGDDKRNEKRQALGSPKAATPSKDDLTGINPLDLPDDEFEKLAAKRFK